jgi:competence protein ComEC
MSNRPQLSPRQSFLTIILLILILILIILASLKFYQARITISDQVAISFFNVGQGDAILIQKNTRDWSNHTQLLIDGGPNRSVLQGLGDQLPFFDRTIEYVIATHPDADHIGGLSYVFDRYQVQVLVDNGQQTDTNAYKQYVAAIDSLDSYYVDDQLRQILILDDATATLLPVPNLSNDRNDDSVILRIDVGSSSVLLTGDASKAVEEYLMDQYPNLLKVDILKLGHHGSSTSTSVEFLQATSPDHIIISAPVDSRYGHPHDEVLAAVKQYGLAQVHMTGFNGTTTFKTSFDNQGWQLSN